MDLEKFKNVNIRLLINPIEKKTPDKTLILRAVFGNSNFIPVAKINVTELKIKQPTPNSSLFSLVFKEYNPYAISILIDTDIKEGIKFSFIFLYYLIKGGGTKATNFNTSGSFSAISQLINPGFHKDVSLVIFLSNMSLFNSCSVNGPA